VGCKRDATVRLLSDMLDAKGCKLKGSDERGFRSTEWSNMYLDVAGKAGAKNV
jgi:hypothetical protein